MAEEVDFGDVELNHFCDELKILNQMAKKGKIEDNLCGILDKLLYKVNESHRLLKEGIFSTNFSEAALVLQSASAVYARKVNLLWDHVLEHQQTSLKNDKNAKKADITKLEERLNRTKRKKIKLDIVSQEDKENELIALKKEMAHFQVELNKKVSNANEDLETWDDYIEDLDELDFDLPLDEPEELPAFCILPHERFVRYSHPHILSYISQYLPQKLIEIPGDFPEETEQVNINSFYSTTHLRDLDISKDIYTSLTGCKKPLWPQLNTREEFLKFLKEKKIDDASNIQDVNAFLKEFRIRNLKKKSELEKLPDETIEQTISESVSDVTVENTVIQGCAIAAASSENVVSDDSGILDSTDNSEKDTMTTPRIVIRKVSVDLERLPNDTVKKYQKKLEEELSEHCEMATYVPQKKTKRSFDSGFFDSMSSCSSDSISLNENLITSTPNKKRKLDVEESTLKIFKIRKVVTADFNNYEHFFLSNYMPEKGEGEIDQERLSEYAQRIEMVNTMSETESIQSTEDITVIDNETDNANTQPITPSPNNDIDDIVLKPLIPGLSYEFSALTNAPAKDRTTCEDDNETMEEERRYNEWKQLMQDKLQNRQNPEKFDIHEYESNLLESFPESKTMKFSSYMTGKSPEEVCKYFIASLHLANTHNIEFSAVPPGEMANDHLEISLLSLEKHHEKVMSFEAPSECTSFKRKSAFEASSSKKGRW